MGTQIKRIGILTGGGDCPGLNSVIYGIMLKAYDAGIECVGILKGWKGFNTLCYGDISKWRTYRSVDFKGKPHMELERCHGLHK